MNLNMHYNKIEVSLVTQEKSKPNATENVLLLQMCNLLLNSLNYTR